MKLKNSFLLLCGVLLPAWCASCSDDASEETISDFVEVSIDNPSISIEGITVDNYPVTSGAQSVAELRQIIACNLLKVDYCWIRIMLSSIVNENTYKGCWAVVPDPLPGNDTFWTDKVIQPVMQPEMSGEAYRKLVDGQADIVITGRKPSADEIAYAQTQGVTLLDTPIAKDALVFIVNQDNPVNSLTEEQIRKIYAGELQSWSEVGGTDGAISPYEMNAESDEQAYMKTDVMGGLEMPDWPILEFNQISPYQEIAGHPYGIACTSYHCCTLVDDSRVRTMAVNGILPDKESIADGSYPYVTEIYATVRSDIDHSSMAYKLYEALITSGHAVVEESGYIPLN